MQGGWFKTETERHPNYKKMQINKAGWATLILKITRVNNPTCKCSIGFGGTEKQKKGNAC